MYIAIEAIAAVYASILIAEVVVLSWYFRHHKARVAI
jgi:hypothetical protein